MSKIKVGKLTHKLCILFALLAFLTIAAPPTPAEASSYQLSGVVRYQSGDLVKSPVVAIYKWDGSSWVAHGDAYADECGNFTYDTGSPGLFSGSVEGYYIVRDDGCGMEYAINYVTGSRVVGVEANSFNYMGIIIRD